MEAPFEILVEAPSEATVGSEIHVIFHIYNRMFSPERIVATCSLHQDILITGPTNFSIDVSFRLILQYI